MRPSRNLWITLLLAAAAAVLLWNRYHAAHRSSLRITDLAASSPLNQPGGAEVPAEAYQVYSGIYQTPADEPLAFAQDSGTDVPQLNGSCLKPSTPDEKAMADAFEAANRRSQRWDTRFHLPGGYSVLSPRELDEAQTCLASHTQNTPQCTPYKALRHVRILGVPGFDSAHNRALVSILIKCGPYCGTGGIFEAHKENGRWKRADPTPFTSDCSWRY
ncbi:MAG TPA: hypothetical protein VGL22_21570 [Terracidiphilus sp.]